MHLADIAICLVLKSCRLLLSYEHMKSHAFARLFGIFYCIYWLKNFSRDEYALCGTSRYLNSLNRPLRRQHLASTIAFKMQHVVFPKSFVACRLIASLSLSSFSL